MPREFTTFFHTQGSEARQKAVDVYTAHTELHLALVDSSLVLPGNDSFSHAILSPPKAGLAISPRYIPCRVRFDAKTTGDEAKAALLHTFSNIHTAYVVEAWELVRRRPNGLVFKHEIIFLVMVPVPPLGPRAPDAPPYTGMADPVSDHQRGGIPAFAFQIGTADVQIDFPFRPKHCWGCKGFSTAFHRTEMCINASVPCGLCQKRDHTGIACPRKTSLANLGLHVVTLNCGPGGLRARQREFTPAARNLLATADTICLQESRVRSPILPDQPDFLRAYFNTPLSPTTRALLTNDCSILIRSPSLVIEDWDFGKHWAYIRVSLPLPPSFSLSRPFPPPVYFGIFSIHGPFTHNDWIPIRTAVSRLHPDATLPCIFGADWNSIPDAILDSSNARPTDSGWTFFRITRAADAPVLTSARRLDSILCSGSFVPSLHTSTSVFTSSDHHAVSASFGLPSTSSTPYIATTDPSTNRTLTWALHPGLWQSIPFLQDVRAFVARYQPTYDSLPLTPLQAWKLLSVTTQDQFQRLSISHGSTQRLLLDDLAAVSAALVLLDCRSPLDMTALPFLLARFRKALTALDLALTLPYASRLAAAELRLSSWPPGSPRPRLHLAPHHSQPLCSMAIPTDCATLFHHLLSSLPPALAEQLSSPFSTDEVASALRRANRRASPGPDGLPYRVWSELLPVAGPLLASLANALGAGASLEVSARTILLPKTGDLSNLANYRPISISDSYAAFIPGRRTTLVSGLLQGLIDTTTATPSHPAAPAAFFVISLDQRKAYDRQFLTSRLWHSISLGGLPHDFNDLYFEALNPYIFAPTKPYISRDDLTRPRSLGGFNLLHPDHMAIALSISFLRNYLSDPGPIGSWLRLNLTAELRHRHSAVPAILLARSSPSFTALQHADARAEGLFGRLLHALASFDLGIAPEWKELPAAAIITLPWLLLFPSPELTDQRQVKYLRSHWVTVGDMLWLGPRPRPAAPVHTFLGLPPSRSATAHNRLSSAQNSFGGVPSLPWSTMWSQLEPRLAAALTAHCLGSPNPYRLLTPDALSSRTPSETWIPLSVDPAYPSFPWHLLTIAGRPLLASSPRSVRRSLTPQEPRIPGWTLDPPVPSSFWTTVWAEL
ncbi:unnamed protein product [Tilletia caries]|nr:unnamed protein product [Tilletia caries]